MPDFAMYAGVAHRYFFAQPSSHDSIGHNTKYAAPLCVSTSVPSMSLLLSLSNAVNTAPSSPGPKRTRKFINSCARNAVGSIFICRHNKKTNEHDPANCT